MKNIGVAGPDSSNEATKSSALPITYLLPNFSSTKSLQETSMHISPKIIAFEEPRLLEMKRHIHTHGVDC